jgi:hypothetical protein
MIMVHKSCCHKAREKISYQPVPMHTNWIFL